MAGIAAESLAVGLDPKLLAELLYPVLAFGPPAVVGSLARDYVPERAAVLVGVGFGVGLVLELEFVGVTVVPVGLAMQRVALATALGLFAFGVARGRRRTVAVGSLAWVGCLALPLFGLI